MRFAFALLLSPFLSFAQSQPAPMTDAQALTAYERCLQLMEAGGLVSPEMGRAGAPLMENMRQTLESIRFLGSRNAQLHYRMLQNLRAFILLSDAVPRPALFPEAAKRQLAELRDLSVTLEGYFVLQIESLQQELRNSDRDNLRRYREENMNLPPPSPQNPRVVFIGDSMTQGWRLNEYFPGRDFLNRGISGQITSQMLARFLADVVELKPQTVVIWAGTNDIARGVDPAVIQRNLSAMCDLADHHKIKVVLAAITPVTDHHKAVNPAFERTIQRPPTAIIAMNSWIQKFAFTRGYAYADYYQATLATDLSLAANLTTDGLHLNADGYRLISPVIAAALQKTLAPVQPPARKRRLF
jgi:lysophospholipase L1-like esterase